MSTIMGLLKKYRLTILVNVRINFIIFLINCLHNKLQLSNIRRVSIRGETMFKKQFKNAESNSIIDYVVYREHTLGYLFKNNTGQAMIGILRANVLKGAVFSVNDDPFYLNNFDDVRKANDIDFEEYRVKKSKYSFI